MAKPDTLLVDGHALSWQRLCELRRQQLEAWKAAQPSQPALFELQEDFRPAAERTAAGRYSGIEPVRSSPSITTSDASDQFSCQNEKDLA
jgi:hypothetical protein